MEDDAAGDLPIRQCHFDCDVCGASAGRIGILPPSAPFPPREGPPGIEALFAGRWLVDVEHYGRGSTIFPCDPSQIELITEALAEKDYETLRREHVDLTTFICKSCDLPYCLDHMPIKMIVDGVPMYDYYFETRCPKGHVRRFERI